MKYSRILLIIVLFLIIGSSVPVVTKGDGSSPWKPPDPKDPPGAITQDYG